MMDHVSLFAEGSKPPCSKDVQMLSCRLLCQNYAAPLITLRKATQHFQYDIYSSIRFLSKPPGFLFLLWAYIEVIWWVCSFKWFFDCSISDCRNFQSFSLAPISMQSRWRVVSNWPKAQPLLNPALLDPLIARKATNIFVLRCLKRGLKYFSICLVQKKSEWIRNLLFSFSPRNIFKDV